MKITKLETFLVAPRWCFLKIETDAGISGWGEPIVEGRAQTVAALVDEISDYLIGRDPGLIEDHWTVLFRGGYYRGGALHMSALAGIDQALWDIHGKRLEQPVHQLLGGQVRDRVKIYASLIGTDIPTLVDSAKTMAGQGLSLLKMNAVEEMAFVDSHTKIDAAIERIDAVRNAIGYEVGLGIDIHGRAHRSMVKDLVRELDKYRPSFIEEPVLSENIEILSEIGRWTSAPIALGERLCSRWEFKPVFAAGHVDLIQPDPSHAGGITECRKIAAMAEAYDIGVAFHCPLGPIALAANLQLSAVCYNAQLQEQRLDLHDPAKTPPYLNPGNHFGYSDGYAMIPTQPGLGIDVDEDAVRRAAADPHRWRNPLWRHPDGSLAEW